MPGEVHSRSLAPGPISETAVVRRPGSTPCARLKHLPLAPQPRSPPSSRRLLTFVEAPWTGHGEGLLKGLKSTVCLFLSVGRWGAQEAQLLTCRVFPGLEVPLTIGSLIECAILLSSAQTSRGSGTSGYAHKSDSGA